MSPRKEFTLFPALVLVVVVLTFVAMTPAARADTLYTYTVTNDPTFGSYSWSFLTPTIFTSSSGLLTTFESSAPPSGCTISSVQIESPQSSVFFVDTNFGPSCNGFSGEDLNTPDGPATAPGTYGSFNDFPGTAFLAISQVPEPSSMLLLGTGLLALAGIGKLTARAECRILRRFYERCISPDTRRHPSHELK